MFSGNFRLVRYVARIWNFFYYSLYPLRHWQLVAQIVDNLEKTIQSINQATVKYSYWDNKSSQYTPYAWCYYYDKNISPYEKTRRWVFGLLVWKQLWGLVQWHNPAVSLRHYGCNHLTPDRAIYDIKTMFQNDYLALVIVMFSIFFPILMRLVKKIIIWSIIPPALINK